MQFTHSYLQQSIINFNFSAALAFHHLDKTCKEVQKKRILADKAKEESLMEVEGEADRNTVASFNKSGNSSNKANEVRIPQDIQSRAEQMKQKLMKYKQGKKSELVPLPTISPDLDKKHIDQIIFNHFSNELRPKILLKYPTAPPERMNNVILQKWNSLEQSKKDAYTRLTLKKIEAAKQAKKQEDDQIERPEKAEGEQEEVLVKQQAPEPEPEEAEQKIEAKENRFGDFLNRIKKNIKGMEEQNEKNKAFKEENEQESRMEEEGQAREGQQNQEKQEQGRSEGKEGESQRMQEEE